MAMQSMMDFLMGLMRDADAREAFLDNPERVLTTAGFTAECGDDFADMRPFLADNPCISGGGDDAGHGDAEYHVKHIINNYRYDNNGDDDNGGGHDTDVDGDGNVVIPGDGNSVVQVPGDGNEVTVVPGDDNIVQPGDDNTAIDGDHNNVSEGLLNVGNGGIGNELLEDGLLNDVEVDLGDGILNDLDLEEGILNDLDLEDGILNAGDDVLDLDVLGDDGVLDLLGGGGGADDLADGLLGGLL